MWTTKLAVWWASLRNGDEPESVDKQKSGGVLLVDSRISPDFADIGRRGSHFFLTDSSHYLKRHVETLQIKSGSHARRRLTVDVQLPTDPELGRLREDGLHEFWMPVTFLAKYPSRSNVDVRDDRGGVVPLLTRSESNEVSIAAATAGVETLLGQVPSPFLKALLEETIRCDGMKGEVPLLLVKEALEWEKAKLDSEEGHAYSESLRTLSGNYSMWVGFHGRPGERRVIKFHYDVEFERQGVLRQRPTTRNYLIFGKRSWIKSDLKLNERGDKNPYSPIRRVMARVASSAGLGAVNVGIESPYIVGSDSYHLQVESPPGVETRDIDLLATVEEEADTKSWSRDHGAHLYVSRARLAQESAGLALLTLRIGRRGFMTLAWLSVLLSASILWLFDLTAKKHFESAEATAAVLLFGPALLAALVVRPGEHPVATKLFSGIRLLVALNGILVVGAAAAVAGVRPEGWNHEHTWFILAIVASGSAAAVSLAWIFSWDITYKLTKGLRRQLRTGKKYRRLCAVLAGLTGAVLVLGPIDSWISAMPPEYLLLPLAGLAIACWFVAAGYAGQERSSALLAAAVVTSTGLATMAAVSAMVLHLACDWSWEGWWLALSTIPLIGLISLAVNDYRWKKKKARERLGSGGNESGAESVEKGSSSWFPDPDTRALIWLQQTPSGRLVRQQARKKATGIPDLVAPSAYREVKPPEELMDPEEARKIFEKFREAWVNDEIPEQPQDADGSQDRYVKSKVIESLAEQNAKESSCELVSLNL